MIQVSNLSKTFLDGTKSKVVLNDLNMSVKEGHSVAVTGESGSGKSSLLHILATLDNADSGCVQIDSQDITGFSEKQADQFRKQKIGIEFQKFNLIDSLSVKDNVNLPARLIGNFDHQYSDNLLKSLGILNLCEKMPNDLSGGEQQRVAIARALSHKPKLLLADEPTGNLDDYNSQLVADLLFTLCRQQKTTLILVTHSHELAKQATHHLHLKDGKLQTY